MTWSRCPVCGKPHQRWAGSQLDRHAVCLGTPDLHDDILWAKELFPKLTVARLAADLHLSKGVVTAWLQAALRRRFAEWKADLKRRATARRAG